MPQHASPPGAGGCNRRQLLLLLCTTAFHRPFREVLVLAGVACCQDVVRVDPVEGLQRPLQSCSALAACKGSMGYAGIVVRLRPTGLFSPASLSTSRSIHLCPVPLRHGPPRVIFFSIPNVYIQLRHPALPAPLPAAHLPLACPLFSFLPPGVAFQ